MMSKLVSDLFDIAEFAHHGPENCSISAITRIVHLPLFPDQLEAGNSTSVSVFCIFVHFL